MCGRRGEGRGLFNPCVTHILQKLNRAFSRRFFSHSSLLKGLSCDLKPEVFPSWPVIRAEMHPRICGTCKCRGGCKEGEGRDPALQNEVGTFLLSFYRGFGGPRNMDTTPCWSVGSSTDCLLLGYHRPSHLDSFSLPPPVSNPICWADLPER